MNLPRWYGEAWEARISAIEKRMDERIQLLKELARVTAERDELIARLEKNEGK